MNNDAIYLAGFLEKDPEKEVIYLKMIHNSGEPQKARSDCDEGEIGIYFCKEIRSPGVPSWRQGHDDRQYP